MGDTPLETTRAEAFAGRMLGIVNDASLALMVSLGHRAGLFDALDGLPPSTCSALASRTGMNERYLREWLGAMVTGGIVEHDPVAGTYRLPPEHAASLTRAAGVDNLASIAPLFACLGGVEDGILRCFKEGGGVPYEAFDRFHEIMHDMSVCRFDEKLVDHVLPLVDGLVDRLRAGIDVADVGCGSGHAINVMARAFPQSRFTGIDLSEEGLQAARAEARAWKLGNARFEQADLSAKGLPGRYDLITAFDSVHDQARPRRMLADIRKGLLPGGTFLMVDVDASSHHHENVDHLLGPFLYAVSTMHCMTVSLAQDGEGLGAVWGRQKAQELLEEAGFELLGIRQLEGDPINAYYVCAPRADG